MNRLIQGNNLDVIPKLGKFDCVFADPPDNIDLGYGEYKDAMPEKEYVALLDRWVDLLIGKASHVWWSFNARWTTQMGQIAECLKANYPDLEVKPCVQVFTFGQHNKHDLGNNHRPLWRFSRRDAPLFPESIKVPSWRERNGDKRAKPGGRVPGDVFDMQYPYPFDTLKVEEAVRQRAEVFGVSWASGFRDAIEGMIGNGIQAGDVFDFPRVTGNSKQRCDWHPTQLHEELVERCIKLTTPEGGAVLDPFGGTGTTLRVCKKINRPCTLIELDSDYCAHIAADHNLKIETFSPDYLI